MLGEPRQVIVNRLMVPIEVVGQLRNGPTLSVKTQNACPKSDFRAGVPTDFQLAESLVIFFGNLNAPMGTGHAQVYFFGALYLITDFRTSEHAPVAAANLNLGRTGAIHSP